MASNQTESDHISFWAGDQLQFTDEINNNIWAQSPDEQNSIHEPGELDLPGSVGAQQAMIEGEPLPWVPNLLGRQWQEADSLVIVGSAYAPFIRGLSKRRATLPLQAYRTNSAEDFLPAFLQHVVRPDMDYYGKIAVLAKEQRTAAKNALFDLCRASFTERGTRIGNDLDRAAECTCKAGKQAGPHSHLRAAESRRTFDKYVQSRKQREWTRERLLQTLATRIIALGTIAEYGLLKFFFDLGVTNISRRSHPGILWSPNCNQNDRWMSNYAMLGQTISKWSRDDDWWIIQGTLDNQDRSWYLLPTLHPCSREINNPKNKDHNYRLTRKLINKMGEYSLQRRS